MELLRRDDYAIDALELKALSVPSSLLFLLAVECDAALCMTTVGSKRKMSARFPVLGPQAKRLLELCASRLGLSHEHKVDHSIISGIGALPVLRYADFLPGQLHMDEILSSFGIAKPKTHPTSVDGASNSFVASFIDYTPYANDDTFVDLSNGLGFCMTLERGLSLATHSHLVAIRFTGPKGASSENIRKFQRFCGWNTFDLRFDDESTKCTTGVVVMPSVQDAMDLFEKYEDEDSDDDGDADSLPFSIRPVAPLVSVPFVEDAQLRKFRQTHWAHVVAFWESFPKTKHCVVVSNLYDKATLADVLKLFDGLSILQSCLVEDASMYRRRRAFITFGDATACREALCMDGKNTHGKALRIQVSPPYVDEQRRGIAVRSRSPSPSPQMTPSNKASNASGRSTSPLPDLYLPAAVSPTPPQRPAQQSAAAASKATSEVKPNIPAPRSAVTPAVTTTAPPAATTDAVVPPASPAPPADDAKKVGMNAAAKEFIPKFALSPAMTAAAAPPPYGAPPPYIPPSPSAALPVYAAPPPYVATPQSAAAKPGTPSLGPPAYSLPPPYVPGAAAKSPQITSSLAPPHYTPPSAAATAPPPPPPPGQQ